MTHAIHKRLADLPRLVLATEVPTPPDPPVPTSSPTVDDVARPSFKGQLLRQPPEQWRTWMMRVYELELFRPWPTLLTGQTPRPWRIGLYEDLLARLNPAVCTPRHLRRWCADHCAQTAYIRALALPGTMRFDIDGRPVEPVSDEHREVAAEILRQRREFFASRAA